MIDKDKLLKSKHFCIVPFVHTCVFPDKRVFPCCMNQTYVYGKTDEQSLEEIFSNNNEKLLKFRREMINGPELPLSCHRCNESEPTVGSTTYRDVSNRLYGHLIHNIDFDVNGVVREEKISTWDVRFSNLCNLKCRTCDDISSSKIAEEERRDNSNITILKQAFEDKSEFLSFFEKNINYVEEIYFCGGEPLMLEEHYEILDMLLKHNRLDLNLRYNTNCTRLTFRDKNVLDYWKKFNKVQLAVSLDAGWEQIEYIRHGSDWNTIVENLRQIKEHCPYACVQLGPTVSILSAFYLTKMHLFLAQENLVHVDSVYYNLVKYPSYYSITSLPLKIKENLEQHWKWYIAELTKLDAMNITISEIEKMIRFMYSLDTSDTLNKFRKHTLEKDNIRKENFQTLFPELMTIFNHE